MLLKPWLFLAAVLFFLPSTMAQEKEPAFTIPDTTHSPDGRLGVSVPTFDPTGKGQVNNLIEIASGKVIAVLEGNPITSRANHENLLPSRWSPDGKFLLWEVDGKWFPHALVMVDLRGKEVRQFNLLDWAQKTILTETEKAAPEKYALAKERNKGSGSAYPDGFSVDVEALDPLAFPLRLRIALTSNPKGIEDFPTLESSMQASLTAEGKLEIQEFKMEPGVSRHF